MKHRAALRQLKEPRNSFYCHEAVKVSAPCDGRQKPMCREGISGGSKLGGPRAVPSPPSQPARWQEAEPHCTCSELLAAGKLCWACSALGERGTWWLLQADLFRVLSSQPFILINDNFSHTLGNWVMFRLVKGCVLQLGVLL